MSLRFVYTIHPFREDKGEEQPKDEDCGKFYFILKEIFYRH